MRNKKDKSANSGQLSERDDSPIAENQPSRQAGVAPRHKANGINRASQADEKLAFAVGRGFNPGIRPMESTGLYWLLKNSINTLF